MYELKCFMLAICILLLYLILNSCVLSHSVVSDSLQPHILYPPQDPLSMGILQTRILHRVKHKSEKRNLYAFYCYILFLILMELNFELLR